MTPEQPFWTPEFEQWFRDQRGCCPCMLYPEMDCCGGEEE